MGSFFWGLSTRLFATGYALKMRQVYAYAANKSTLNLIIYIFMITIFCYPDHEDIFDNQENDTWFVLFHFLVVTEFINIFCQLLVVC